MAFTGILLIALVAGDATLADAFASGRRVISRPRPTIMFGTVRPDASEAVADALRATEEHGPTSQEARVAWDIVEEMDSNDGSAAYAGTNAVDAPRDYRDHIHALARLLEDTHSKLAQMEKLISQIKDMELTDPSLSRLPDGESSDALKAALADAKAAVAVHGASSPEAKEAWDKLDFCFGEGEVMELAEECDIATTSSSFRYSAAALKAHHVYDAAIEAAVLNESLEALGMIQGLQTVVTVEQRRLDSMGDGSVGP